jgi:indole-3-glycerol phosphate synthase
MRPDLSGTLKAILLDTAAETRLARRRDSLERLQDMVKDAPPVAPFAKALGGGGALIAEIKEQSPSQGRMREENFRDAPQAYKKCAAVKAVSVVTNRTHFGACMGMEKLQEVRETAGKPVLRKDFITEEYQVYHSRAGGADAILLMANILDREEMKRLSDLAFELGMEVLFETHRKSEVGELPARAGLIGINSRNFEGRAGWNFKLARVWRRLAGARGGDRSVDTARFGYVGALPSRAIRVAESGVTPQNCAATLALGFHAVLVGTSLLMDQRGVAAGLKDFEAACAGSGGFK